MLVFHLTSGWRRCRGRGQIRNRLVCLCLIFNSIQFKFICIALFTIQSLQSALQEIKFLQYIYTYLYLYMLILLFVYFLPADQNLLPFITLCILFIYLFYICIIYIINVYIIFFNFFVSVICLLCV